MLNLTVPLGRQYVDGWDMILGINFIRNCSHDLDGLDGQLGMYCHDEFLSRRNDGPQGAVCFHDQTTHRKTKTMTNHYFRKAPFLCSYEGLRNTCSVHVPFLGLSSLLLKVSRMALGL